MRVGPLRRALLRQSGALRVLAARRVACTRAMAQSARVLSSTVQYLDASARASWQQAAPGTHTALGVACVRAGQIGCAESALGTQLACVKRGLQSGCHVGPET